MITLTTMGVGPDIPYFARTNANKAEWCAKHGYRFVPYKEPLCDREKACWNKFLMMSELMDTDTDYVAWMDADMWIFNQNINIESVVDDQHDIFVSRDPAGLNLGVFVMRASQQNKDRLAEWFGRTKWLNHLWSESMAFNEWATEGDNAACIKEVDRQYWNTFFGEPLPCNVIHLVGENPNARNEYFRQCSIGLING